MSGKLQKVVLDSSLLSTEDEVKNLLEMFEFYLVERGFGKSIVVLRDIIGDLRTIIGRLLTDHFLKLQREREAHFCATLATLLLERAEKCGQSDEDEHEYIDYCIEEVLMSFEYAQEIKSEFRGDPVMQRLLMIDIPILRPFDYGLRQRIRLVKSN
ncbi:MAG: hypothetical protein A3I05_02715 [Deltaproteobacteria bacterium RIFCSPLOWO2_02_FULL_44_10]|nr:MAG: hypothetical protein A3C46_03380 [Deltaproteobacteria bacterium RIFCSPHIGHO2_02_FULL_44_16]OGQ46530.1 MAG: hypothetical protein A3I05_02715 [Deltaproteobacteria bacterium RIFCSPLOWO2_02_FULL_44_10]